MPANYYKGHLKRADDGSYTGMIKDEWGWLINLRAVIVEDPSGQKYFKIDGNLGEPPAALKIAMIDDPQGADA